MDDTPEQIADEVVHLVDDVARYGSSVVTFGQWPEPCLDHGMPDDPQADRCPTCDVVYADPETVGSQPWWATGTIRDRVVPAEGADPVLALAELRDLAREAWKIETAGMLAASIDAARRSPVEVSIRMHTVVRDLPPELGETPRRGRAEKPDGGWVHLFTVSQARRILQRLE